MKAEVEQAIDQIKSAGVGTGVQSVPDADGGAYVLVDGIDIGAAFSPSVTWLGFQITWSYPDADCYPHFIDAGVKYVASGATPNQHVDGDLPTAMSRGALMPGFDRPAIQISRRSNRRVAETDSALQKLLRIIDFVRSR